jgi:uncharacterized protein
VKGSASRSIPETMDGKIVARIDAQLVGIEAEYGVKILLAIESGSRAWGFPSPDSDYDCRFIYVRPERDYLSLWPRRDVIEAPQDKIFDINGWDLAKAIRLLMKGNAVVIEWLTSPISYKTDPAFRSDFLELARQVSDRRLIGRHYLHLGERQRRTYFRDGKPVPQKKIFYALRPAAALRWLRFHPKETVAPMHFPTLLAEAKPPKELSKIVERLIARKAQTRELGSEPLPEPVREFIDKEFELARAQFEKLEPAPRDGARELCDHFFVAVLKRFFL